MDGTPWVALARASHSAPDPRAANGFMLASFVLVMYEWVLTADSEIQHIWLKPWTAFTAYWVAARYLPIAGRILGFIGVFKLSWTHEVCKRFAPSSGIIFGCSLCVGHLALLMRVHVLWERRWAITLLPSILWFLELGANVYPIFDYTSIGSPLRGVPGCTAMTLGRRESLRLIAAIAMAVAFDLSVTGLLLLRSASLDRQRSSRHPLVHMLLMHGVAYFMCHRLIAQRVESGLPCRSRRCHALHIHDYAGYDHSEHRHQPHDSKPARIRIMYASTRPTSTSHPTPGSDEPEYQAYFALRP
ncbi:hypothetical protein EXIGLDRAFT_144003 [Exidia glandulosa HHB12029]|uniref:DUF6533 domain-containing protein n=1 Tax=Exidia glandulosa HHB12029 TaxID=1314781 RepID=A0A166BF86_EXIGL|nr:hypothetical protein EXIGLDRAFT_144003 [Exidia glandulosa HHB12029]